MSLLYADHHRFILSTLEQQWNSLSTSSNYFSTVSIETNNSMLQSVELFHRERKETMSSSSSVGSSLDISLGGGGGGSASNKRAYLSDQKKPFDHLKPKAVVLSTTRVVFIQLVGIVSTAISDQLQEDLERERKIRDGLLTPEEAEREYEEKDWVSLEKGMQCIQRFPHRCLTALLRGRSATGRC